MVYDCGSCMVKYVLCGFNFLIFIAGTVVLGVGIWLLIDTNSFLGLIKMVPDVDHVQEIASPAVIKQVTYVLITVGAIIFLVSAVGYCGALKESQWLLTAYGILLIVILVLEISVGVLVVMYKSKAEEETKNLLKTSLKLYYNSTDSQDTVTFAWDNLQRALKCCGVDNGKDYQENELWKEQSHIIPPSCCILSLDHKPVDQNCTKNPTDSNSFYNVGCFQKIMDWITANTNIIIVCAAVLGLVEVVGVLFSFCLAKSINRDGKMKP